MIIDYLYLTEVGADILISRIRQYWSDRGFSPSVWKEPFSFSGIAGSNNRHRYFQIRSDMVGGLPQ